MKAVRTLMQRSSPEAVELDRFVPPLNKNRRNVAIKPNRLASSAWQAGSIPRLYQSSVAIHNIER